MVWGMHRCVLFAAIGGEAVTEPCSINRFYDVLEVRAGMLGAAWEGKRLNEDPYLWSMLTGSYGGWANILNMKNNRDRMRLYDDDNEKKGHWGSIGYPLKKVDDVDAIEFTTYIFLLPPNVKPAFMDQLVNLVYRPVQVRVGRTL